jgi:hypothetical protein
MPVLSSLNIHRRDRGSHAIVALAGELDLETAHSVRSVIEDCLGDGIRTVDIDLTLLTFCDSAASMPSWSHLGSPPRPEGLCVCATRVRC